jgi:hypothetical protein
VLPGGSNFFLINLWYSRVFLFFFLFFKKKKIKKPI